MESPGPEVERRVLIVAPIGRDAGLTGDLLARAGIEPFICASISDAVSELAVGAGAIILTEEVFDAPDFRDLPIALDRQPPWSDVPIVLFAGTAQNNVSLRAISLAEALRNVTFLERPIRMAAVVSVVRAAIRARMRQYDLRDSLVALDAARAEAEAASRLKDEFLATLSHELRTPLNAILGWTTMLRHGQVDQEKIGRALDVVERNARAQAQLIEDVLDMARIITGKVRLDMRSALLASVVEAAVDAVRPAAEVKSIRLRTTMSTLPPIHGDAVRLQQVLWNLLTNAVKFTPPGGTVTVALGQRGSDAVLTVTDSGPGIAPDFLPYVFDRFRQADQSVTRGHGGLGLGLSIVKHLVELHGGRVRAFNDGQGGGATFEVVLPLAATLITPHDQRMRERGQDAFAIRLDGAHILIVDDDAATRELLANLIGRTGASVDVAESVATAMQSIRSRTPTAIITDIGMPAEDGYSLMRRIRALPPPACDVPAIALSAYTRAEDRGAAQEAGFASFIAKPATPQQLLRALETVVQSPEPRTRT
jgi:signal transduction histidine kinase/ActR/RegA family two-component response regulator